MNYPHCSTPYPQSEGDKSVATDAETDSINPMTRPRVLITEPIATSPLEWLRSRAQVRVLDRDAPSDADLEFAQALVVRTYTRVDEALLNRAPNLRVVARAGVGLDNIDLDACRTRGIPVVHTPAANTEGVVEFVISMMLRTLRPIVTLDQPLEPARWGRFRDEAVTPRTCVGTSLGIVGMGRIGSRVARVAESLGMRVVYHDLIDIDERSRCGAIPMDLETLASQSQVLTIHVDGRASNAKHFGSSFFAMLRPDVVLINASRGMVLDTDAATEFAKAHPQARLILDVHDPEPIPVESQLWGLRNVILTPHIAAGTRQAKEAMSWVVRDVMRVLSGEPPEYPAS